MSQRRSHSAVEAIFSTSIGFAISYAAGFLIFPLLGMPITPAQNLAAVAIYTVISIVRGYGCRRLFNWLHDREYLL